MAEEQTQTTQVLPPENVDAAFRPYYALLVDRAIAELRAGRSDIELRVELQKITPSKAVLEAGFNTEQFIAEAILFAKSVFSPKISLEGLRIEPIIEKLGAPSPPKASDLFEMVRKLKERERLIRTAGFEAQRAALRDSLDEVTQRLSTLKIPVKQAGAFPFELASSQAVGVASAAPTQQQGLIEGARYLVVYTQQFGGIYGDQPTRPQELKFVGESERGGVTFLDWKTSLDQPISFAKKLLVSAEVTSVPLSAVQVVTAAPAAVTIPSTTAPSLGTLPYIPTSSSLEVGQESLTLPAGTEETRRAIEAKIAEGFVLSKVTSNNDGTATFIFTRVSAVAPQPISAPAPQLQPTPAPTIPLLTSGSVEDLDVEFGAAHAASDSSTSYPLGPPAGATARRDIKLRNKSGAQINPQSMRADIYEIRSGKTVSASIPFVASVPANGESSTYVDYSPTSDLGWTGNVWISVGGQEKAFQFGVR